MGINPVAVLAFMTPVGIGTVLAVYFACDAFAMQAIRVRNLPKRTEEKMRKVPPFGLYSSVVIGWIAVTTFLILFVFGFVRVLA